MADRLLQEVKPPSPPGADTPARMPRQIPFIIANEGCERFSFYGMRNILTVFLSTMLLTYLPQGERTGAAKEVFHTFVIGVYLFPMLGGWLSDRFFGKYNTVLWFSLIYCAGHACLALFDDNVTGFYTGLLLIALGSGGIKPLVASFVGDQFDQKNKHLAKVVFDAFYWMVNVGSFLASLTMPIFLRKLGPAIAFGIPGALMFIATIVFWSGRRHYVMVPPAPPSPDSFLRVVRTALSRGTTGKVLGSLGVLLGAGALALTPQFGIVVAFCLGVVLLIGIAGTGAWLQLDRARDAHPDAAIEGVRAVLRLLVVFALTSPFWSLFDQKASTWVIAADAMVKPSWFEPSQMQAFNPFLVLVLIPLNTLFTYPALRRLGWDPTPLRRMVLGLGFAALAWVAIGGIQLVIDGGAPVSLMWQIGPYILLTLGEVLISTTGLEFSYSQAPPAMKGVIMSFWYLSVTMGNVWVLMTNSTVKSPSALEAISSTGLSTTAFLMFFFAAFAGLATAAFAWYAGRYKMVDHYRTA